MLKVDRLSYRLRNKYLIREISLGFSPGILYGILGPNGSGKTTLLKTITGIWKPSSGNVFWSGVDLLKQDRRQISRTVSLVPQSPQLYFDFPVAEFVKMGLYPHQNLSKSDSCEWALSSVDAWHLRNRSLSQLSSGERQRIYIARALVTESPIMLLDEPAASLDIRHHLEIWNLMKTLASQGKTIIVTNHDLAAAQRFCDKVVVLFRGQCIAQGSFAEAVTENLLSTIFGVKKDETASAPCFIPHFN